MSTHTPGSFEWAKDQVRAGKTVVLEDDWNLGEYTELVEYKPGEWRTRSVGDDGWEMDMIYRSDLGSTDWRIVELTLGGKE